MAERLGDRVTVHPAFAAVAVTTHALLRAGTGAWFMQRGAQKVFGWFGGFGETPGATGILLSRRELTGGLEFFGGAMIDDRPAPLHETGGTHFVD